MLRKLRSLVVVLALLVCCSLTFAPIACADILYGVFKYSNNGITAIEWFPTQEEAEAWLESVYSDDYFVSYYGDDVYIILKATSSAKGVAKLTK